MPGVTTWSSHRIRIRIRPGLDRQVEAAILIHELGHVLAHGNLAAVPGASTAGCRGVHKIEADSVAFVVAVWLGMDALTCSWPPVASWAGSDARARPQETIRGAGGRITGAAMAITAHLSTAPFAEPPSAGLAPSPGPEFLRRRCRPIRPAQVRGVLAQRSPALQLLTSAGSCSTPTGSIAVASTVAVFLATSNPAVSALPR
jgi:hypothetical protein